MISKILDFIEKRVQPKKEEEPMTNGIFGVPIAGIDANTSTVTTTVYPTQYTQGLSAQNAGGTYPLLTTNYCPANVGAATLGGAQVYTTYANQYNSYVLPMMSGILVSIAFRDASGATYAVTIDQAYVQILQDISRNIQMTYGNQQAMPYANVPQQHLKMLDGDFSEEEMTEAEGIIAELEGSHGPEAPHP